MLDLTLMTLLCWSASGGNDCMRRRVADTTHEPFRVCYYASWARYREPEAAMLPSQIDPFMCTHLIMAFARITEDNNLDLNSPEDEFVVNELMKHKIKNPDLKVLAAIGGWNAGSEPFRRISATNESRKAFVKSALEFLEKWNFNGLDIHWEYPEWLDSRNFASLIQSADECFTKKAENGSAKYLLTAAVPAVKERLPAYDVSILRKHLDFINVMTYDFNGPWDNRTGHNAPLNSNDGFNVIEGARMWVDAGMPRPKIMVGLPMYGHSFKLKDAHDPKVGSVSTGGIAGAYTKTPGFFAYFEVCDLLKKADTTVLWDYMGSVPFTFNNDTWVSFDDPKSLEKKVDWILNEQYGGVMIWELSMDDFSGSFCGKGPNDSYPLFKAIENVMKKQQAQLQNVSYVSPLSKATTIEPAVTINSTEEWCNFTKPIIRDCNHFLTCVQGQIFDLACLEGLAFDEVTSECVPARSVPGCYEEDENYNQIHSNITETSKLENVTLSTLNLNETVTEEFVNSTELFQIYNLTSETHAPLYNVTELGVLSSSKS